MKYIFVWRLLTKEVRGSSQQGVITKFEFKLRFKLEKKCIDKKFPLQKTSGVYVVYVLRTSCILEVSL